MQAELASTPSLFQRIKDTYRTFAALPLWTRWLLVIWAYLTLGLGWVICNQVARMQAIPSEVDRLTNFADLSLCLWMLGGSYGLAASIFNFSGWGSIRRLLVGSLAGTIFLGGVCFSALLPSTIASLDNPIAIFFTAPVAIIICTLAGFLALVIVVYIFFFIVTAVPKLILNKIQDIIYIITAFKQDADSLTGHFGRIACWFLGRQPPEPLPDDSKGARLATAAEIAALRVANDRGAIALGHVGGPLFLRTEKHALIMASTRSGKGVTLIIPHLLRYPGSAFVLDPKGENAKATGRRRAAFGAVHYLDPFGISGKPRSRFNPLARFTPDNMEAESKALAAALFLVGDGERDHWNAAGQQLLAAIILYVFASPKIPKAKKDLGAVRRLLLGQVEPTLKAMAAMDEANGLIADLALSFLETPEKERGSIISTAQRQTEILDNPAIIACLAASGPGPEVDFKTWRSGTMTVYLCLAAPKFPTFNRWLRLVLTSALDEMTDTMNPPLLPVCFMLDELATLGHLQSVENAVGLAAGYGIQLVTVFQDVAQMRDLYRGRWASFISNAGVRAVFNLDDYDTADYWSKFIGGHIAETRNEQRDTYGFATSQSASEAVRPLFPPEKLMMDFAAGQMLVLPQGSRPIISERVPYWNDAQLKGLWDDPRARKS